MKKKNIYLYLYLSSWSLISIIWLVFLIIVINLNVTFADVRVGRVVVLGGVAILLSIIPVFHIILCLYWYMKKWRSKNNLIYITICILILMISLVGSSKHISHSIEKNERLYVPPAPYQP